MDLRTLPSRRRVLALASLGGICATFGAWRAFAADAPRVIPIVASRFKYEPNVVRLKLGEPVILELTTADIAMGFNAVDFKVRADVLPGKPARVAITPDKVGTFTFLCDIFCGTGHEDMNGTIVVEA